MSAARALLAIVLCGLLAGCDDTFGDQASDFVDNEAYSLSKAYAEKHLDHVWTSAAVGDTMDMMADLKAANGALESLADVDVSNIDSSDASHLVAMFKQSDEVVRQIASFRATVEGVQKRVNGDATICNDEGLFYSSGLGAMGLSGPVLVLMRPLQHQAGEIKIGFSYSSSDPTDSGQSNNNGLANTLTSLGLLVLDVFGANKTHEQNEKLRSALDRLPQKVIQPKEIFRMSQSACVGALASVKEGRDAVASAITPVHDLVSARMQNAGIIREVIAARLRPMNIAALLKEGGVASELGAADEARLSASQAPKLEAALTELAKKGRRIRTERTCLAKLLRTEDYLDENRQILAQLAILRTRQLDSSFASRVVEAANAIAITEASSAALLKRSGGGCK